MTLCDTDKLALYIYRYIDKVSHLCFLCVSSNCFLLIIFFYIDCNGMPSLLHVFMCSLKLLSFYTLIAMLYFLTVMVFMCSLKLPTCENPFSHFFSYVLVIMCSLKLLSCMNPFLHRQFFNLYIVKFIFYINYIDMPSL